MDSSSFDPIFDTLKCDVPEIPPISNEPFISDCEIPPEIDAIFDCGEIDLPPPLGNFGMFVGLVTPSGTQGPKGEQGDPGADGADGSDGCDPELTISRTVICTYNAEEVEVEYSISETSPCVYNIHFDFTIYCGYNYSRRKSECCWWVWCACEDSENVEIPEEEECGFASTYCDDSPGEWNLIQGVSGDCGEANPPCLKGAYHGQVEIVCDCEMVCYELTNCSDPEDIIYTSDSQFESKTVGTVFARAPSAGGGCYELTNKEADCEVDNVVKTFDIGFERDYCAACLADI